jgi:Leucine-rich repeat (LRR) protein
MVFPQAFKSNEALETLSLDNIQLKWPKDDLIFLKRLSQSLNKLSMSNAFPKKNVDNISVFNFCAFPYVDELSLQGGGLISIVDISAIFPSLTILDVSHNKIFSTDSIEELHKLP